MRLCEDRLALAAGSPVRFDYDRGAQEVGIVHLGIGAFHRAHQAWYTDLAMSAGDRDWAISGVSLRSRAVADQLNPQDGLYTVTERSGSGQHTRIVGAVREVIAAAEAPATVEALIAAKATRIVSLTVTEKGYCRGSDGRLDPQLAGDDSIYRFIARGLRQRHDAGLGGLTFLSCDNLAQNGHLLAQLIGEYLDRHAPALRGWFEEHCTCPSTMVDRIVPATTDADRAAIEAAIGLHDAAAVVTEPFSQWIIEDHFAAGRPRWDAVGAKLVSDVTPYETAKLRMLNGAHSALAYLGLRQGHHYVHEAVADPAIRPLIEQIMRDEAAPTITAGPDQDLDAYATLLLERFANPALHHRLAQIAMDGSQKIPQRWLDTLAQHALRSQSCPALLTALAAWIDYVRGDGHAVDDPLAAQLANAWRQHGRNGILEALFGSEGIIDTAWRPSAEDRSYLIDRLASSG